MYAMYGNAKLGFALHCLTSPLAMLGNRLPSVIYYITEGNAKLRGNRLPPSGVMHQPPPYIAKGDVKIDRFKALL